MTVSPSLLAFAVPSLLASRVRSLTVDWDIPSDGRPYESVAASVGDAVRFEYEPGHNVVLHPTGTCDDAGGVYLGGTSPTEYSFGEAGNYTFACDVAAGAHCSFGQIITITVADGAAPSDENADGGEEGAVVADDGSDDGPGASIPPPPEEDPEEALVADGAVPSDESADGGGEGAVVADDGSGNDPGASIPPPPEEDPEEVLERFGAFFNEGEDRGLLEFRMKPYAIPSEVTTYVDFLFNVPEDLPEVVHIVAGDVINSQPRHLHHFVLTGCAEPVDPAKEGLATYEVPESCSIPLGGGWALGGDFFGGIPSDSGEVFGVALGIRAISLNVHYTDGLDVDPRYPNDGKNAIATDGFRMMYTSDLRPKTIVYRPLIDVGVGPPAMRVPPNDPRYFLTKMCTVESGCRDATDAFMATSGRDVTCEGAKALCSPGGTGLSATELMFLQTLCPASCGLCDVGAAATSDGGGLDSDGWRVDAVSYHAHLIGREMYATLLPNERSDVPIDLESKALWLYDNQVTYPFPKGQSGESHFKVFPGDKIQASCVYDSTSREGPTSFDVSTYDEMCITQVSVVIDTPDISADGGVSLVAMINSQTFNCALDEGSDIWGGSLDGGEDARDIWKDHAMSEADCTFPVGAVFGGSLSFKFDASPNFQVHCKDGYTESDDFSICRENEILDEFAAAGEICSGGSMDEADSNDLSRYNAEDDATFGEQCVTNGGFSDEYTCKEAEDYFNEVAFFDVETLEFVRTFWYQPKCCTELERISICDRSDIMTGNAIAGENCNGGSMDGANSNDPSSYDAKSDATFKEQCSAKGGLPVEYTCKQLEDFFFNGPSSAGFKREDLELIRVQYQPKCCTESELVGDTLLDEQFCQHYYTLDDGNCQEVRAAVRSEVRGSGTPTLEMGNSETQPAMVFLHGWPDTAAIWANQFAEFCGERREGTGGGGHFCVAPSWIDFHPDVPRADESELLWSNQVEAFRNVFEDLDLTGVTLVVFDFGALLGYQLAFRYPDLVARVVGLDIGLMAPPPIPPFSGLQNYLPKYQQNNIEAFLADDDAAMAKNLETELGGTSPCHDCRIAPPPREGTTIGVGARTGWPYYNIVRMDKPWTSFFDDVPLAEWEWSTLPSFPEGIPLLFLYSSTDFHDESFRDWIDGRGDGVSEHAQMNGTDHWLQVRVPAALNAKIVDWMIIAAAATGEGSGESSGESSGDGPVKVSTGALQGSADDPDEDPTQGENGDATGADVQSDGPEEAKSGTFAESLCLLFLLSVAACFMGAI